MRHVGRDRQDLSGVHHDLAAVDPELQRTLQNIGHLLVDVPVLGNDAAFFHKHSRYHDVAADHELALQQRIQLLEFHSIPGNMPQLSLGPVLGYALLPEQTGPRSPSSGNGSRLLASWSRPLR